MSFQCWYVALKKEGKGRVYDKKQDCYYCVKLVCKIARHYEQKHPSERQVAIALSFNKGSPTRKKQLEKLRLLGSYHHNVTVLETGKGELWEQNTTLLLETDNNLTQKSQLLAEKEKLATSYIDASTTSLQI